MCHSRLVYSIGKLYLLIYFNTWNGIVQEKSYRVAVFRTNLLTKEPLTTHCWVKAFPSWRHHCLSCGIPFHATVLIYLSISSLHSMPGLFLVLLLYHGRQSVINYVHLWSLLLPMWTDNLHLLSLIVVTLYVTFCLVTNPLLSLFVS